MRAKEYKRKGALQQWHIEYLKDNGHNFTTSQMSEFLQVSYAVINRAYKRLNIIPWKACCADACAQHKFPSIEEYKQLFLN